MLLLATDGLSDTGPIATYFEVLDQRTDRADRNNFAERNASRTRGEAGPSCTGRKPPRETEAVVGLQVQSAVCGGSGSALDGTEEKVERRAFHSESQPNSSVEAGLSLQT